MMETLAEIRETLKDLGEPLTFDNGTIYGILETERTFLEGHLSFSAVESIEHSYVVSTQDYVDKEITTKTTFTATDNIFIYSYEVAREAAHTGDGWSRVACDLISMELL